MRGSQQLAPITGCSTAIQPHSLPIDVPKGSRAPLRAFFHPTIHPLHTSSLLSRLRGARTQTIWSISSHAQQTSVSDACSGHLHWRESQTLVCSCRMFAGRVIVDRRRMWGHGRERPRAAMCGGTRIAASAALLRVIAPNLARLLTRDRTQRATCS